MTLEEWFCQTLSPQVFWVALSSIALIFTFFAIWRYTQSTTKLADKTSDMSRATEELAKAQREITQLEMRPVVSVFCLEKNNFNFITGFKNFGRVFVGRNP